MSSPASVQKTVLITGATSGIGKQLVLDYVAEGWQVIACGRGLQKLESLKTEVADKQPDPHTQTHAAGSLSFQVFDIDDQQQVLKTGQSLSGHSLDLVILNAGVCEYMDTAKPFDSSLFERVIHTNLNGMAYCLEAFIAHMPAGSHLALMGSSANFFPFPRAEAYGASKAGVAYLAQSLALDLKAHAIDVSLISPGFVETPLTDKNDFPMPMRISVEAASLGIRQGLAKRRKHIGVPRVFTGLLALLGKLPYGLQHWLALRMVRS